MSVRSITIDNNAVANTLRGPTDAIWGAPGNLQNAWVEDFMQNPAMGLYFFDDFVVCGQSLGAANAFTGSFGQWSLYQGSNSGTIQDGSIIGGGIQFVPSSGTASSGASTPTVVISGLAGSFQIMAASSAASSLQGRLAFEARVMLTSVTAAKRGAFIGLADQTAGSNNLPFIPISAGSSNELASTRNLIGFYAPSSGNGNDWQFVFQAASTAPVFCSNLNSLVSRVTGSAIAAGTFYKLGFVYDPAAPTTQITTISDGQTAGNSARAMITVYVNGLKAAAFLTQTQNILTASFPTGIMAPIVAFVNVSNSGTSNSATNLSGLMTLDWLRVAQNLLA